MYNKKPLKEMTIEEKREYDKECRRRHQLKKINGDKINDYDKTQHKPLKEMTIEERRAYNRDKQKIFHEKHKDYKTSPETRLNKQKRMQKKREKEIAEGKRKDLNKSDIPIYERCEGFDELWDTVYMQVLSYWDEIPKSRSKYNIDKPTKIKK
jgi:hypothetical protein